MILYKRILNSVSVTLVAVFASVFLIGGTAYAQPVETNEVVVENPLLSGETQLEESRRKVTEKLDEMDRLVEEATTVKEKRDIMSKEVESLKTLIEDLNDQVEAKKAAEEAARIAEIRRQEAEEARVELASQTASLATPQPVYDSGNNTYTYGYCTWYVKTQRTDIPNGLGNANTWYYRYSGAKGTVPQVGAVATNTNPPLGHVAIVHSVNGDGTITIREMNGSAGWNVVGLRDVPASSYVYIY